MDENNEFFRLQEDAAHHLKRHAAMRDLIDAFQGHNVRAKRALTAQEKP